MKPEPALLQGHAPDVGEELIREHLQRLDESYFAAFPPDVIGLHLQGLARLSPAHPIEIIFQAAAGAQTSCTVLSFDHPSAFSLICGALASVGFSIESGDVFTYAAAQHVPASGRPRRDAMGRPVLDPLRRRRIVDRFVGQPPAGMDQGWMETLRARLEEIAGLLEQGDAHLGAARRRINDWVATWLSEHAGVGSHALAPVQVQVERLPGATRMRVTTHDTPAFLYAFSTGLSLRGVSIERVRIATIEGTLHDEIDILGPDGQAVSDPLLLDLLRVSAVLTKQFTYFLDRAPDPSSALERFNLLVRDVFERRGEQWLVAISNPDALQGLARVLGASDFLWEDFVRVQYESLLPFFKPQPGQPTIGEWLDTAPQRLAQAVASAQGYEERRRALNEAKDQEAFMADLEHVLSGGVEGRRLSLRLTSLAERVVRHASAAVYDHLVERHGQPENSAYAIFGLGKLGGASIGYASDIELLVVYAGRGRSAGPEPIDNGSFFAELAQGLTRFIQAKEDGLLQIDMKLRPFGIDGPLATTMDGFRDYYGPGGPAHSLERLALTRLRAIAGDPELGREIEQLRDDVLYFVPSINLDELRTTRTLQLEQKSRMGSFNAKYSPGGLVDVEYATEILQVLHGKHEPSLRTPYTEQAIEALSRVDVLNEAEAQQLAGAYDFLSRVINGLRMLRGWAGDLFIPDAGSEELEYLARRIGYQDRIDFSAGRQLQVELQVRTATVRAFVERRFGRAGLPGRAAINAADLILSDSLPVEARHSLLSQAGFRNPERALTNLRRMATAENARIVLAEVVTLALPMLARTANPDGTLEAWRQRVDLVDDPEAHFRRLLEDVRNLETELKEGERK